MPNSKKAYTKLSSDRNALIRLASSMEKGSTERRAILAGLKRAAWGEQPLNKLDVPYFFRYDVMVEHFGELSQLLPMGDRGRSRLKVWGPESGKEWHWRFPNVTSDEVEQRARRAAPAILKKLQDLVRKYWGHEIGGQIRVNRRGDQVEIEVSNLDI